MSLRLIVASLFVAGTAYAQAPGEVQVQVVPVAPVAVVVAPPVEVPVMANRWSVGLSLGGMGLASDAAPDAKTNFSIGELAVRFRATPHLEIEVAFGGGRQHDDGMDGDLEVNTAAVALRYRFMPHSRWNWYLLAGLGAASVTSHEASDQERSDSTRGMFEFGVGIERRFAHFALDAEFRGIALGETKADQQTTPVDGTVMGASPASTVAPTMSTDKMSGGQFTIGASYYFLDMR